MSPSWRRNPTPIFDSWVSYLIEGIRTPPAPILLDERGRIYGGYSYGYGYSNSNPSGSSGPSESTNPLGLMFL
jgi:hypothetical protein